MCGIAGFFTQGPSRDSSAFAATALRMAQTLHHRGPDGGEAWVAAEDGIALAFRRLAILDLSPNGMQPMTSACQRFVIVFNGEIYNFQELREEITANGKFPYPLRGHSDTEILLACVTLWGLEATLPKLNGMFAIALWDKEKKTLSLARDRLGKKPLYYGWCARTLLFGSELKALRAHPEFSSEINPGAAANFIRYAYVPAPDSIYSGIKKLPPGTWLETSADATTLPKSFWDPRRLLDRTATYSENFSEATDALESLLRDSVKRRMVSDVPLGAFLSGGVDSSLVTALMQAQSSRPIKTFTIGFQEDEYDEAKHAKAVAAHLKTEHTELYFSWEEARSIVPLLPTIYDEPFADSSQIPSFLVSKLARGHVTVALTGDGGDEIFGGYNRYLWGQKIWRRFGWIPRPARRAAAAVLTSLSADQWAGIFKKVNVGVSTPADKVERLAGALGASDPEALYAELVSLWPGVTTKLAREPLPDRGIAEKMMYWDLVSYLPDDILTKLDRASMAASLEARSPLLDYRVVEFAWRLPLNFKLRKNRGKHILREVLNRYVPNTLIERPKMGFGMPIGKWLRGPLRDWAETHLSKSSLEQDGFLDARKIRERWNEHVTGKRNWQYPLWSVLMFAAWREEQKIGHSTRSQHDDFVISKPRATRRECVDSRG